MDTKTEVTVIEKTVPEQQVAEVPLSVSVGSTELQGFDQGATKTLVRKLDWHLIPFLSLIYLLCFLDRTNIGNARLDNLEVDLGLKGLQYNDCLAILFPFYIAAEIPSNMMMKRFRPSIWLTFIMVFWSVAMICQGFVKNYSGLMATRVFLGVFEGGLFPGVNYYITSWYRRHECGFRMALFFSAATLAGAFGGILARGIAEMDGVGGLAAWSWIFILEGLLSIVVSAMAYWVINDYPATAKFLTTPERDEVQRRLTEDHGSLSNAFDYKYVFQALKDWKIYIHCLISSWFADRAKQRGVFMLGFQIVALVGFAMLAATSNPTVQYTGVVLAAIGIYPQVPLGLAWNGNNLGGSLKRGTGIAMQVMGGNCGGIIASYVYLTTDSPRYIKGHSILIGIVGMAFFLTLFMTLYLRRENSRRDSVAREKGQTISTEEQKLEEAELADDASWFRYTV